MTVLLADDDLLVGTALKTILQADKNIEVVGCAASGSEAVFLYAQLKPNVCLFDIRMNNKNGLEAAAEILGQDKSARILFLTTFKDDEYILKAINMGSAGYILKQDFERIIPSLYAVHAGQSILGRDIVARLPSLLSKSKSATFEGVDVKEKEIIELVASGLSNKEISAIMFLSEGTVRNYISTILEKLQLRDRTQLAIYYYKNLG